MISTKDNQTIVFTGESGAGKSENVKQIIRYLMVAAVSTGVNQLDWFLQGNVFIEVFTNRKLKQNIRKKTYEKIENTITKMNFETFILI